MKIILTLRHQKPCGFQHKSAILLALLKYKLRGNFFSAGYVISTNLKYMATNTY